MRIAVGDQAGAVTLQREVDQLLRRVPVLGVLVEQAGELRDHVKALHGIAGDLGAAADRGRAARAAAALY